MQHLRTPARGGYQQTQDKRHDEDDMVGDDYRHARLAYIPAMRDFQLTIPVPVVHMISSKNTIIHPSIHVVSAVIYALGTVSQRAGSQSGYICG